MDNEIVIEDILITAVMQALKMTEADVRRAVQLSLAGVPLTEGTPLRRAWETYRFMRGVYEPLTDDRVVVRQELYAGNILSNVLEDEWQPFLDAHPDFLVRIFLRREKGLPGIFQFGDIYVEYRPFIYGETLMRGRIVIV